MADVDAGVRFLQDSGIRIGEIAIPGPIVGEGWDAYMDRHLAAIKERARAQGLSPPAVRLAFEIGHDAYITMRMHLWDRAPSMMDLEIEPAPHSAVVVVDEDQPSVGLGQQSAPATGDA